MTLSESRSVRRRLLPPGTLLGAVFAFALTGALTIYGARKAAALFELPESALGRGGEVSLFEFLLFFALATFVLLFLIRVVKNKSFFKFLFHAAIGLGIWTYLDLFLDAPLALALAAAIFILTVFSGAVGPQNAAVLLGASGIAVSFGVAGTPTTFIMLLLILSIYDIIAVYRTGHMVTMARELVRRGAAFAILVPSRLSGLAEPRARVVPGGEFFFLGTGDLALPAILLASVARQSLIEAIYVYFGMLVGATMMVFVFFSQRLRRPMPALPPIAACTILGYLLGLILL